MKYVIKYGLIATSIFILIISNLSCIKIKGNSEGQTSTTKQTQTASGKTRPHPPIRTGEITLGTRVEIASQSIGKAGGSIAVAKQGSPLDGFVISVSPESYSTSRTFKVSSAPITKQTFGSDINPISPMITVDNGGVYSEKVMYVRVPVNVPEGYFAMGFIYDDKSRQLEGLPLVGMDSKSITIATSHFSGFFISMVEKALLKKDADSGFRPGIDDWQFTNRSSYIAPSGHCEGQSLTAMWYYCTQPDGKDLCLYGRYDNNGEKPATPTLWQDDSLGYRFCSMVQKDNEYKFTSAFWDRLAGLLFEFKNNKWEKRVVPGISDETTFNLFVYSIRATGEPQEVGIFSNAGAGHAMVVYKMVGNALYIADPNYPGNADRKIIYYPGEGKFKPYSSGTNREEIDKGNVVVFEKITYQAKSTIVSWDTISRRWAEFKNKTIGNDKFPQYVINVVDDNGKIVPLMDGYSTAKKNLMVWPESPILGNNISGNAFRDSEKLIPGKEGIELKPGNNQLGIWTIGKVGDKWKYIDFKYYNVKYEAEGDCKAPPQNILAKLQQTTKFKSELLNLPTTIVGSGSMNKWVPGFKFTKHFYVPGNAIKLGGDGAMPIKWSGTSFSGGGSKEYPDKLTGSVCYSNGQVLVSFDYATNDPVDNLKISVKNLPCDPKRLLSPAAGGRSELTYMNTDASVVKKYVTSLAWKSHEERVRYGGQVDIWDASLTAADWTQKCGFDLSIY